MILGVGSAEAGTMTTKQEWLLIALAHRRGQVMTPAQIQKAMFLMRMEAAAYPRLLARVCHYRRIGADFGLHVRRRAAQDQRPAAEHGAPVHHWFPAERGLGDRLGPPPDGVRPHARAADQGAVTWTAAIVLSGAGVMTKAKSAAIGLRGRKA